MNRSQSSRQLGNAVLAAALGAALIGIAGSVWLAWQPCGIDGCGEAQAGKSGSRRARAEAAHTPDAAADGSDLPSEPTRAPRRRRDSVALPAPGDSVQAAMPADDAEPAADRLADRDADADADADAGDAAGAVAGAIASERDTIDPGAGVAAGDGAAALSGDSAGIAAAAVAAGVDGDAAVAGGAQLLASAQAAAIGGDAVVSPAAPVAPPEANVAAQAADIAAVAAEAAASADVVESPPAEADRDDAGSATGAEVEPPEVAPNADEAPNVAAAPGIDAAPPSHAVVLAPPVPAPTNGGAVPAEPEVADARLAAAVAPPSAAPHTPDAAAALAAPPPQVPTGPSDLSGSWDLTHAIDTTTYLPYLGLRMGYRVRLRQEGEKLVGTGERWSENGRVLPGSERTPISLEGKVVGRSVTLRFTEEGSGGKTGGVINWQLAGDGNRVDGIFASSAARSSGLSKAKRLPGR